MLSEDFESEYNYIVEDKDQFTQTSTESVLLKLKKTEDVNEKPAKVIFEHCQIIQDPENLKSVTIVKEFITEEVKNHRILTGENSKASRYKYTREVIHPRYVPKLDKTESCEVLVKEALRSAKKDFPDFHPSLEVYHTQKPATKLTDLSKSTLISKVDAQTSYFTMESDPDKVCLSDCSQAEDVEKCKQACKELNEARKSAPSGARVEKPPCGKPVHRPPVCEKQKNCRPKQKTCNPKSDMEKNNEEILVTDSNCRENIHKQTTLDNFNIEQESVKDDEVIVTNFNSNEEIEEILDKISISDIKSNQDFNRTTNQGEVIDTDFYAKKDQNKNSFEEVHPNLIISDESKASKENILPNLDIKSDVNEKREEDISKMDSKNIDPNIVLNHESSSGKTYIEAHNAAISSIKLAMEDFMEVIYKTTQDAVSIITCESAKAIAKIKVSEVANMELEAREKELENKSSERIKKVGYCRKDEKEAEPEKIEPGTVAQIIDKVVKTADSALCLINNQINKSIEDFQRPTTKYGSPSSEYDVPKTESCDKPAHVFTPDTTNGVFSALKNKIYSIFSDTGPKTEVSNDSSSSSLSTKSDNCNMKRKK